MDFDADREGLLSAVLDAVARSDRAGLIFHAGVLADWCDDHGEYDKAQTVRRDAAQFRWPRVRWPAVEQVEGVSDHQREQLHAALCLPFGLLTGGPGTGKTHTLAAVIKATIKQHGVNAVAVAAPTGKAAVRLNAALVGSGVVSLAGRVGTIHQLLEIGRNGHDGDGWGFRRNGGRPLDQLFVYVDEPSMLDTSLCASLLEACREGTHVLLSGDPHQLPPVGHGSPLRDLIAAGLPRGHLAEVRRNSGGIVEGAALIRQGKDFPVATGRQEGNLRHVEAATPEAAIEAAVRVCRKVADAMGPDAARHAGTVCPHWAAQVIVASNRTGPLSRRAVNQRLQAAMNPDGGRAEGNPYRTGDKIICTHNGWHLDAVTRQRDVYVANGEIGRVVGVEPRLTLAEFESPPRCVRVPMARQQRAEDEGEDDRGGDAGTDFDLGWAITTHKAQGSEWPFVVVLIDDGGAARRVCSREWLYTAVTRASRQTLLVGRLPVAYQMTRRVALERRKTFLREFLTAKE